MRAPTVILALLMLVLSGCGNSGDELGDQLDKSEPWDLVWFSDSMGEGVAEAWADLIEEAEGVEVRVRNYIIGAAPIERFRTLVDTSTSFRQEVADAEIIVVYGNPSKTDPAGTVYACAFSPLDPNPPEFSTSADFAPYGDAFRDAFDLILELRAGEPTVIRVFDMFAGNLVDWREAGTDAECTAAWEALSGAIREAADEYGVAMASVYDAFNGPDHDDDPREKGYVADDGYHPSHEAASALAEILHSLGYGAIIP